MTQTDHLYEQFTPEWVQACAAFLNRHIKDNDIDVADIHFVFWESFLGAPDQFANDDDDASWWLELKDGIVTGGLGSRRDGFSQHIYIPFDEGCALSQIVLADNPAGQELAQQIIDSCGDNFGTEPGTIMPESEQAGDILEAVFAPLHDFVALNTLPVALTDEADTPES